MCVHVRECAAPSAQRSALGCSVPPGPRGAQGSESIFLPLSGGDIQTDREVVSLPKDIPKGGEAAPQLSLLMYGQFLDVHPTPQEAS